MSKENLPAVIEVLRFGIEIKEKIMRTFWSSLTFRQHQPTDSAFGLSWKQQDFGKKPREFYAGIAKVFHFGIDIWLGPPPDKAQALKFRIEMELHETHLEYLGFGLGWTKQAENFTELCQLPALQDLRRHLNETPMVDTEPEPNNWWFWYECWSRKIHEDPWVWLAKERDVTSFEKEAKSF